MKEFGKLGKSAELELKDRFSKWLREHLIYNTSRRFFVTLYAVMFSLMALLCVLLGLCCPP